MQFPDISRIGAAAPPTALTTAQGYTANVHRVDGKFMTIDLEPTATPLNQGPKPGFHLTVGGTHVTVSVTDAKGMDGRSATRDELRDLKNLIGGVEELGASEKQTILTALDAQMATGETAEPLPVFPSPAIQLKGKAAPYVPLFD